MCREIEQTYPFTSKCSKNYLISFSIFKGLDGYNFNIPVINLDLVLVSEVKSDATALELSDLKKITNTIFDYISNNDVAVYYYCDRKCIPNRRSKKNELELPQKYRSLLFGKLFESCDKRSDLVKHDIEIKDPNEDLHLISLISKKELRTELTQISQTVERMNDK